MGDGSKKSKGRGGAGRGQGRKKSDARQAVEHAIALSGSVLDGRSPGSKEHAAWLIQQLNAPYDPNEPLEVTGWRRFWDSINQAIALDTRRYLHDKAGHRAIQIINHQHDKPLEVNATLNLGEGMRVAMRKAEERVRNRK